MIFNRIYKKNLFLIFIWQIMFFKVTLSFFINYKLLLQILLKKNYRTDQRLVKIIYYDVVVFFTFLCQYTDHNEIKCQKLESTYYIL